MSKSKTHEVIVKIRVDRPITTQHARYAVWNNIHGQQIYGMEEPDSMEPWGVGKITVSKSAPRKRQS